MAIMVIVELPFKAGGIDEFAGVLRSPEGLAKTRAFKGFQSIECVAHRETNTFVFVEKWDTKEDHEAYMKWRADTGMMEMVGPMLAGEFTARYLEILDC